MLVLLKLHEQLVLRKKSNMLKHEIALSFNKGSVVSDICTWSIVLMGRMRLVIGLFNMKSHRRSLLYESVTSMAAVIKPDVCKINLHR